MIIFETPGEMPMTALATFGVNAKPNSDSPIGQFGTGLKYALAITLRLNGEVTIYTGGKEHSLYFKKEDFRDTKIRTVHMKSRGIGTTRWTYRQLPFTLDLGKHWEAWMAIRELESNTRDEGGSSYMGEYTEGNENTVIAVDCEELEQCYVDRVPDIFMDSDAELIGQYNGVQIFKGLSNHIYYKGIRVTTLEHASVHTYNIVNNFYLTEDRTDKYSYSTMDLIKKAILAVNGSHNRVLTDATTSFESSLHFDDVDIDVEGASQWFVNIGALGEKKVRNKRAADGYEKTKKITSREETTRDIGDVCSNVRIYHLEAVCLMNDEVTDSIKEKLKDEFDFSVRSDDE